jgi:hypothetical protein
MRCQALILIYFISSRPKVLDSISNVSTAENVVSTGQLTELFTSLGKLGGGLTLTMDDEVHERYRNELLKEIKPLF